MSAENAQRAMASVLFVAILSLHGCGLWESTKTNPVKTLVDIAEVACELFGQEHPAELRAMVPPDALDGASPEGVAVPVLCAIPRVLDFFMPGAALAVGHAEGKAGLRRPGATPECTPAPALAPPPPIPPDAGVAP